MTDAIDEIVMGEDLWTVSAVLSAKANDLELRNAGWRLSLKASFELGT